MSRLNIKGKVYDFGVGVDHATGVFLQIWKKPWSDQDGCFLKIEGKNLVADESSEEFKSLPKRGINFIKVCVDRMQKGEGDYLSPEHVYLILQSLDEFDDVEDLRASVYRVMD